MPLPLRGFAIHFLRPSEAGRLQLLPGSLRFDVGWPMTALWEEAEFQQAKNLFEAGKSPQQISKILGRSVCSVARKLARETGKATHLPPSRKWTDEEKQKLSVMRNGGATWRMIAREFGTTEKKCQGVYERYGLHRPVIRTTESRTAQIPASVMDDYVARLQAAPRDLSALVFGDPKPGWSALERRA